MGNHAVTGHAANYVVEGATLMGFKHESFKFENTARTVMKLHGIDSWNAKALVREQLRRQAELAEQSPLRKIPVKDGIAFLMEHLGINQSRGQGYFGRGLSVFGPTRVCITREQFVVACWAMLQVSKDFRGRLVAAKPEHREILYSAFDSMDFDDSGTLTLGELAGACSVFFRGSTEECIKAVFSILDRGNGQKLRKSELREYLRPYMQAMMSEEAKPLQPLLLNRATDTIFKQMDSGNNQAITADEMLQWTRAGRNIIDSLAEIIDREVYSLWLQNSKDRFRHSHSFSTIRWGQHQEQPGRPCSSACSTHVSEPEDSREASSAASDVGHGADEGSVEHFHGTVALWGTVPPPPSPPGGSSQHMQHYGANYGELVGH